MLMAVQDIRRESLASSSSASTEQSTAPPQSQSPHVVVPSPRLKNGFIKVHMAGEVTAVFWLRHYLDAPSDDYEAQFNAEGLDYTTFIEDLERHFGYNVQQHSIVWDPRGFVNALDCQHVVRGQNAWVTALIAMQTQRSLGEEVIFHFHIVNYIEYELYQKARASKSTKEEQVSGRGVGDGFRREIGWKVRREQ